MMTSTARRDLCDRDTKVRWQGVVSLQEILEQGWSQHLHENWQSLVEALVPCIKDNNPKVCLGALTCLQLIVTLVGDETKPAFSLILASLVDRLGDSKLHVRQKGTSVFLAFMEVLPPPQVMEKIMGAGAFRHKNWRVREQALSCLTQALQQYGPELLNLPSFTPQILKLLEDSNKEVRGAAVQCLEQAYRLLGQTFLQELQAKRIRSGQWKELENRFAAIRVEGSMGAPSAGHVAAGKSTAKNTETTTKPASSGRRQGVETRQHPPSRSSSGGSAGAGYSATGRQSQSHKQAGSSSTSTGSGNSSVNNNVAVVQAGSERQLMHELDSIGAVLLERKDDWEARIEAMHRFLGLVYGGAHHYPSFAKVLARMAEAFGNQVTDLRSQVVKASTSVLVSVAEHIADAFEPLAAPLLVSLLKLTYMSKEVMSKGSQTGDQCIRAIVACTANGFGRMVTTLLETMQSQNKVLRAHCMTYLTLIFNCWSPAVLERHTHGLTTTLRSSLGDAHANVRSASRKCFWSFSRRFGDEASRLWSLLDTNTQRHLQEESDAAMSNVSDASTLINARHSHSHRTLSSSHKAHGEVDRGHNTQTINKEGGASGAGEVRMSQSWPPRVATAEAGAEKPATHEHARHPPHARAARPPAAPPQEHQSQSQPQPQQQHHIRGQAQRMHGHGHGIGAGAARRVVNAQNSATSHAQTLHTQSALDTSGSGKMGAMRGAQRVPFHSQQQHLSHASGWHGQGHKDSAEPGQRRDGGVSATRYRPSVGGAMRVQQQQQQQQPNHSSASASADTFAGDASDASYVPAAAAASSHSLEPPGSHIRLRDLLQQAMANDSSWSTRLEAWQEAAELIASGHRRGEVLSGLPRLSRALSEALNDTHYKVEQAALAALGTLVTAVSESSQDTGYQDGVGQHGITPYLEELLPPLFLKLAGVKTQTRSLANDVLNLLRQQVLPSALLQAIGKVAEQSNPRIKLGCFEFASSLIPAAADYLHQVGPMKTLVQRTSDHVMSASGKLSSMSNPLQRASLSVIMSLYKLHRGVFLDVLQSLPAKNQLLIKQALQPEIPTIEADLANTTSHHSHHRQQHSKPHTPSLQPTLPSFAPALEVGPQSTVPIYSDVVADMGVNGSSGSGSQIPYTATAYQATNEATATHAPAPILQQEDQENRHENHNHHNNDTYSHGPAAALPQQKNVTKSEGTLPRQKSAMVGQEEKPSLQTLLTQLSPVSGTDIQLVCLTCRAWQGNDIDTRKTALQQIYFASRESSPGVWNQYLGQVLLLVMESLNEPSTALLGLQVISQMLCGQAEGFSDFLEIVVTRLLECYKKNSREISHSAEKTLEQLVHTINPHRCLQVLQPIILVEDGQVLQISIRLLSKVLPKMSSAVLLERLPHITPGLYEAFKNPSADVRKAVVFTLVELYMTLGDHFTPYLEQLNTAQLKLVTIYINRTKKAREATAMRPQPAN